MSDWRALSARITLFSDPGSRSGADFSALNLYTRIWGDPDNFQKAPNPLSPSQASGKRGPIAVACSAAPRRIDFNLSPPSDDQLTTLSLIEDTTQLHTELQRVALELGKGVVSSGVLRVALFVQFVTVKPTLAEANRTLALMIPERYRPDLTDEGDVILQINNARTSSRLSDRKMNFITKWSVDRIQVLSISLPANLAAAALLPITSPQ